MTIVYFCVLLLYCQFFAYSGDAIQNDTAHHYWDSCFRVSGEFGIEQAKIDIANEKFHFILMAYSYNVETFIVVDAGGILFTDGRQKLEEVVPSAIFDCPTILVAPYNNPRESFSGLENSCYYDAEYVAWYNAYLYNYFKNNPIKLEQYRKSDAPEFKFPIQNDGIVNIPTGVPVSSSGGSFG